MTVVSLRGFEQAFALPSPIVQGRVRVEFVVGESELAPVIEGDSVTFYRPAIVDILAGAPVAELDLAPTAGRAAAAWTIYPDIHDTTRSLRRYTLIPDSGTHDFGALTLVDPDTFLPLEEIPPSVQELLHQAETALTDAIGHVDAAAASATQAATSATGAANSATASAASADSAASAAAAADTSRSQAAGAASSANSAMEQTSSWRDNAEMWATASHDYSTSAGAAQSAAATSAAAAAASKSAADGSRDGAAGSATASTSRATLRRPRQTWPACSL